MTPDHIFAIFRLIGQNLTTLITPYALHTLFLLGLIELITVGVTYIMDSDNPGLLAWRIVRLVFSYGFAYWWLQQSWTLGLYVIGSFDSLGQHLSGQPNLSPMTFVHTTISIAKLLTSAPSTGRLLPDLGVLFITLFLTLAIVVCLLIVALLAIFALAQIFMLIGPGSFLIAFMPCRFTSPMSEGYFTWLVWSGLLLLGCYVTLSGCQQIIDAWPTEILKVCGGATAYLPTPFLGAAPVPVLSTLCTKPLPIATLWTLLADALVMMIIGAAVPLVLANMVGKGVSHVLEQVAAAKYIASGAMTMLTNTVGSLAGAVQRMAHESSLSATLQQRMAAGAQAANASANTSSLRPPSSSGGGWNGTPAGPGLPPSPNGSSGGAQLGYIPPAPGAKTRAEAVDITQLQGKK